MSGTSQQSGGRSTTSFDEFSRRVVNALEGLRSMTAGPGVKITWSSDGRTPIISAAGKGGGISVYWAKVKATVSNLEYTVDVYALEDCSGDPIAEDGTMEIPPALFRFTEDLQADSVLPVIKESVPGPSPGDPPVVTWLAIGSPALWAEYDGSLFYKVTDSGRAKLTPLPPSTYAGTKTILLTLDSQLPKWDEFYMLPMGNDLGDILYWQPGVNPGDTGSWVILAPASSTGLFLHTAEGGNPPAWKDPLDKFPEGTAQGDILYWDATAGSWVLLPVGSDGQILEVATDTPAWRAAPKEIPDGTAAGDFLVWTIIGGVGQWVVFPVGSDNQVITVDPSLHLPVWADPAMPACPDDGKTYVLTCSGGTVSWTEVAEFECPN